MNKRIDLSHHADPIIPRGNKETLIRHETAKRPTTSYQVTGLALELSRQADQTIDLEKFKILWPFALETLLEIERQLGKATPD